MAFANTVDSVGNGVLTDSIIDRSITTLADNIIDTIGASAFRGCSALKEVNLPNVKSIALAAFWQCTALETADFSACVSFANNAFYGCTNMKSVILRNTAQVSACTGTPFAASAIASGTGYIYVPQALLSTYKAASGWSTYAAQIRAIEDYPEVCDPYSWTAVAKTIEAGTYATVYKIGDLVPLDLGSEGVVNMQIAAFDADEKADGSGKAAITWISEGVLNSYHRMNPAIEGSSGAYTEGTGGIGGWPKCEMRTYLDNTIKPLIPSDVRGKIKTVTKYSLAYNADGSTTSTVTSSDDVWIPSYREVFGSSLESTGPMYNGYFSDDNKRIKYDQSGSEKSWWLRSVHTNANFRHVNSMGKYGGASASTALNFAIGFCT